MIIIDEQLDLMVQDIDILSCQGLFMALLINPIVVDESEVQMGQIFQNLYV